MRGWIDQPCLGKGGSKEKMKRKEPRAVGLFCKLACQQTLIFCHFSNLICSFFMVKLVEGSFLFNLTRAKVFFCSCPAMVTKKPDPTRVLLCFFISLETLNIIPRHLFVRFSFALRRRGKQKQKQKQKQKLGWLDADEDLFCSDGKNAKEGRTSSFADKETMFIRGRSSRVV